jgi:Icc-related predicted phosphoesterase
VRLQIVSDIHTEFVYRRGGEQALEQLFEGLFSPEADHIVIAGDLSNSSFLDKSFDIALKHCNDIIYVPGNHDYYGSSLRSMNQYFKELEKDGLFVLNRDVVTLDGLRFVGATGWFPYTNPARLYKEYINDFQKIGDGSLKNITNHYLDDKKFLTGQVNSKSIVITHHLPISECVAPKYKDDPLNCYFVSGFGGIIQNEMPVLWIHGHTHVEVDIQYAGTPIKAAPFGYWGIERFTIPEPVVIEI